MPVKTRGSNAAPLLNRAAELRTDLARKIALFIGSAENRVTGIPELTLHRRTATVLNDLPAGRDRDRPGAKACRTRPKHFHLRCVAISADISGFAPSSAE